MINKTLILKNIPIFSILTSLVFWSNPAYGNILRFVYLITFVCFFFDDKYFKLLYSNYKKALYLLIFIFFHYISIKVYNIEIDIYKFYFNSLLILINFIFLICFWNTFKENYEQIFKLYVNILTLIIFLILIISLDFNQIIKSCHPQEASFFLRSYLGEFSHVALLALPISIYTFFYLKYIPAIILLILLFLYLNSFTLMITFLLFVVIYFLLNINKTEVLLKKRNLIIFLIIALIYQTFFHQNCFQRLSSLKKIYNDDKFSVNHFLPNSYNKNLDNEYIAKDNNRNFLQNNIKENESLINQDKRLILHTENLSLQVVLYNLLVMKNSLQDYPFGIGLGNYSNSFYRYKDIISREILFERRVFVLNDSDGSSLLIKTITELGLFSIFILYYFFIFFFNKKINRKYLILLILLLAIQSIRGVGYFNAAGAFLLLSLFYLCKDKNIK